MARGVAVSVVLVPVAVAMILKNQRTHVVTETQALFETACLAAAFAAWQPRAAARRWVRISIPVFVLLWGAGLIGQGLNAEFSYLTGPLASVYKTSLAGLTLVSQVSVSSDRWTSRLWFWGSVGVMLIYGTEVILYPLWAHIFRVRNDLVFAAFVLHLTIAVVGYGLIARAYYRIDRRHPERPAVPLG